MIGSLQVDIIEPQDKNSIFYEFLEEGNVGLHHVGFRVDDVDEKIKEYIISLVFATRFPEEAGLKKLKNLIQTNLRKSNKKQVLNI